MECRYSGARRGISSIRGHWGSPRVCWGVWPLGGIRECRGCQGV